MKNHLLELMRAGKPALGAQLRMGTPAIAELFSAAGYDWVAYDSEHAPQTPTGVQAQIQATASGGRATPIVRLGKNDPDLIRMYLDMGAGGVLVSFINTAADAKRGVDACRYPPVGIRGFGPARAGLYGFEPDYFAQANEQVTFIPMIETAEAVRNIDAILAVPGVDTFMMGCVDLSISLGVPLQLEHPKLQEAIKAVAAAAKRAGKPAGFAVYGDTFETKSIQRWTEMGFSVLLVGGDEWFISGACRRVMAAMGPLRGYGAVRGWVPCPRRRGHAKHLGGHFAPGSTSLAPGQSHAHADVGMAPALWLMLVLLMLTRQNIIATLAAAGLARGDHLVVHSSLRTLGQIDGGADALIDALIDVVGPEGTLAMPAFNYSRPAPAVFDVRLTPGRTGALTEVFRQRPGTLRSFHPSHSMSASGARAAAFLADHHLRGAFAVDSPLDRIAAAGGYVLLLGVSHLSNSTVHVGESHAGVRKFWWDEAGPPRVPVALPEGGRIEAAMDVSSSCSRAFNAVDLPLRARGQVQDMAVGEALAFLMRGRDVIAAVVEMLRERPGVLFCTRPGCRPCTKGREHLGAK